MVGWAYAAGSTGREKFSRQADDVTARRSVASYKYRGHTCQGAEMRLTIYQRTATAVRADALFVSAVQRSDEPSGEQVRTAVAAAVRAYGARGCAARVAQEFGDHPEAAAGRMRWARAAAGAAFGWPGPAPDGARGRPGLPGAGSRAWRLAS